MLLIRAGWGALEVGLWPTVGKWGVCGETCVGGLLSGENGWNRGSERRPMCIGCLRWCCGGFGWGGSEAGLQGWMNPPRCGLWSGRWELLGECLHAGSCGEWGWVRWACRDRLVNAVYDYPWLGGCGRGILVEGAVLCAGWPVKAFTHLQPPSQSLQPQTLASFSLYNPSNICPNSALSSANRTRSSALRTPRQPTRIPKKQFPPPA